MLTNLTNEMIRVIRREVESALVENKLDLISKDRVLGRLSKEEIETALFEYLKKGEKITHAPDDYFNSMEIIKVDQSEIPTWHIDYDLWIDNRRSDLTLSLELKEIDGVLKPFTLDLHIL
ncbi:hypothetical protein HY045_03045 [Candidatus Woesebacteria bacterium]|nr:hypothetical protein [Candidatus Woesebacteria bacterium]